MDPQRAELLAQGYVICRGVIPPAWLEKLRVSYEKLIRKYRDPACESIGGGERWWNGSRQPRLHLSYPEAEQGAVGCGSLIDGETAACVDYWCHPSFHGLSSRLLGVDDAAVADMMLMCSAQEEHGPAHWHRDFYPPRCAPLDSYKGDLEKHGPRYVQWNLALYDDDILWVIPGTHTAAASSAQDAALRANGVGAGRGDCAVPIKGGIQVQLRAGDGVAYCSPAILHWGSNYSPKLRRTIHGGFSVGGYNSELFFLSSVSPHARGCFERWSARQAELIDKQEQLLRDVMNGRVRSSEDYGRRLGNLVPSHGSTMEGRRHTAILLSKAARRVYFSSHPELIAQPTPNDPPGGSPSLEAQYSCVVGDAKWMHTMLQPGRALYRRFTAEEADILWAAYQRIDADLQRPESDIDAHCTPPAPRPHAHLNWEPGFQGGPTAYLFHALPSGDEWFVPSLANTKETSARL